MTREEKIKDIKLRLSKELKHLRSVNDESALEITNILADLDNIEAECCETLHTNDIPIGAPCEFDCNDATWLGYFSRRAIDGTCVFVFRPNEIGNIECGVRGHSVRPIDIWRIPESKGGAPPWAIARAYLHTLNYWLGWEDSIKKYCDLGYTIERRPEEEEI
jgi:hypothetical protein